MMRLLIIGSPFPFVSGGNRRVYEILPYFTKAGIEVTLIPPPQGIKDAIKEVVTRYRNFDIFYETLNHLKQNNISIPDGAIRYAEQFMAREKGPKSELSSFFFNVFSFFTYSREIRNYYDNLPDAGTHFDMIYSQHETWDAALLSNSMARAANCPFVVLLQLEPFRYRYTDVLKKIRFSLSFRDILSVFSLMCQNFTKKRIYRKIISSDLFKGFFAVSIAPVLLANLPVSRSLVLKPANAFSHELQAFKKESKSKKNQGIFFARNVGEKGIFELPFIVKKIVEVYPTFELHVCGQSTPHVERKLKRIIRNQEIEKNFVFHGYLPSRDLFDLISLSKVFIYPSHYDAYPLGILDSLALGTPIVAYDIPAVATSLQNIDAVKIVPEWDYPSMSKEVINLLALPGREYDCMFQQKALKDFLLLHSSWRLVAENEIDQI
jgi:glycosyltransferase involved in cell wall biosynthesis